MKNLLIILTIVFVNSNLYAKEFLSASQKQIVLDKINLLCLDTTCEGSRWYDFHKIQCNEAQASCTLKFTYWPKRGKKNIKYSICTLTNISKFKDIINPSSQRLHDSIAIQYGERCNY